MTYRPDPATHPGGRGRWGGGDDSGVAGWGCSDCTMVVLCWDGNEGAKGLTGRRDGRGEAAGEENPRQWFCGLAFLFLKIWKALRP